MWKLIRFTLLITYLLCLFIINEVHLLFELSFYFLIGYTIFDIIVKKSICIYHIWLISFIYIILSEGIVYYREINDFGIYGLYATKIILISNISVLLGYNNTNNKIAKKPENSSYLRKSINIKLTIIISLFFIISIEKALSAFSVGRIKADAQAENVLLLSSLINAIGLILPAFIAYIFKMKGPNFNKIKPLLFSTPVFLILFLNGSRYPLLFSAVGFLYIYLDLSNISMKKLLFTILPVVITILFSTKIMMNTRSGNSNLGEGINSAFRSFSKSAESSNFTESLALQMSPEGVVKSFSKMVSYFENNNYKHGTSTGFILYFWVPRQIWNEKPTMLGHWLIRDYGDTGFGDGHSASFGFAGDFFADFGIPGAVILSFILGSGLKKLENLKNSNNIYKNEKMILSAMFYPYTFFIVRSPITASITFIYIIITFIILKKILLKSIVNKSS